MALPKIKSTVHTFKTISGKTIHFRPFRVADEQVLLEAKESKDNELIINTVLDILQGIVINKINIKELPSFEVEHLLLQARIVSIGSEIAVGVKCEECEKTNPINIDLNKVKFIESKNEDKFIIGQDEEGRDVTLMMKYPTFSDLDVIRGKDNNNILRTCIDSICVEDIYTDLKDVSDSEIDEWVLSLEKDKVVKIYDYIKNMPKMYLDINYTCSGCKKEHSFVMDNFESFFT